MTARAESTHPPAERQVGASARVGIVGGGQLARMTHQAAISLGVEVVVLAADPSDAVFGACPNVMLGAPDDLEALRGLALGCDVITFDHEGVPGECIEALEFEGFIVRPGSAAKRAAQDKLHARRLLGSLGFPVPDFEAVGSVGEAHACGERWGWPIMLKARRGGYDGRGVVKVSEEQLESAMATLTGAWIAERHVPIERELSQIVVRAAAGEQVCYPLIETVQQDGICVETRAPAQVGEAVSRRCVELAGELAGAIGATGVIAVELFMSADDEILVNELALRPHNSGHLTIEGCETSQFENHLRAVLGWPLGSTAMRAPAAAMRNVIGAGEGPGPSRRLAEALAVEGAHPHLYGKSPHSGRKLAHATALGSSAEHAAQRARRCAELLEGGEATA